ncbi:MAG: tetratricopeptide repeat protein [Helicobacteraceae bacterium]|jgi:tetratricopeptide (TPR) repeat protein|nr:tetratricopeptide repeat protein [Helicobacteraceae bacterium]
MDAKLITIVERLVREQGKDTLIDAKKCKAHLADYAQNEFKKERHLLLVAIEVGAGQAIATTDELDICKKQQIRLLKDDYFIDEIAAAEAVDLLAFALRGDKSQSIASTPNANSSQSNAQQQFAPSFNPPPQHRYGASSQPPRSSRNSTARQSPSLKKYGGLLLFIIAIAAIYLIFSNGNFQVVIAQNSEQNNAAPSSSNYAPSTTSKSGEIEKVADIIKQAKAEYDRKNYQEAARLYSQAIQIDPNNAFAYNGRAFAYSKLNDYSKAIADYDQAIKIDPNNAFAYNGRAFAYSKLNDYSKAIADYTQAIKIDPNNAFAYKGRAYTYLSLKDFKQATKDARKACAFNECEALERLKQSKLLRD